MNEEAIFRAAESIAKQKNEEAKLLQLRSLISGEMSEYEKLVAEGQEAGLSEKHSNAISEFKESFRLAIIRKSKEIMPLLEKEIGMYQKDLDATKRHLQDEENTEVANADEEHVSNLDKKLNALNEEMASYKNILLQLNTDQL